MREHFPKQREREKKIGIKILRNEPNHPLQRDVLYDV